MAPLSLPSKSGKPLTGVRYIGSKSQSRLDEEALAKFGKTYEKLSPVQQLQLPSGNTNNPPLGLPTQYVNPTSDTDISRGFPKLRRN